MTGKMTLKDYKRHVAVFKLCARLPAEKSRPELYAELRGEAWAYAEEFDPETPLTKKGVGLLELMSHNFDDTKVGTLGDELRGDRDCNGKPNDGYNVTLMTETDTANEEDQAATNCFIQHQNFMMSQPLTRVMGGTKLRKSMRGRIVVMEHHPPAAEEHASNFMSWVAALQGWLRNDNWRATWCVVCPMVFVSIALDVAHPLAQHT